MLLGDGSHERMRTATDVRTVWETVKRRLCSHNSMETSGLVVSAMVAEITGPFVLASERERHLMTQTEVNRAVARATGESVRTIQRLGFLIADPEIELTDPDDEDLGPYMLDWDELERERLERPLTQRVLEAA